MKKHIIPAILASALVAALCLMGCAGGSSSASAGASASGSSSVEASSSEPSQEAVGVAAEGAATFDFTNKTGKDIVAVAVKPVNAEDYPANMLAEGKTIKNGETVTFMCPVIEAPASEDAELKPMGDIKLKLADDTELVLHQVVVNDVAGASARVVDGIAFLEYQSVADGSAVSTLEAERAIIKEAEEKAAAAEAEAQAQQQAQNEQYVDYGTTYVDDSAVGSGDEAACVDDIVLNF